MLLVLVKVLGYGSFTQFVALLQINLKVLMGDKPSKFSLGEASLVYFLAQMFLQLALLPPLGHKQAIGTFGYPMASKLED